MGAMTIVWGFLGIIGAGILGWIWQDGYACLPRVQHWLLRTAARRMPHHLVDTTYEQFLSDLNDFYPSELRRLLFAIGCHVAVGALAQEALNSAVAAKSNSKASKGRTVFLLVDAFLSASRKIPFFGNALRVIEWAVIESRALPSMLRVFLVVVTLSVELLLVLMIAGLI